jgi:glycosyltransferase involved in cell wall biosynthesis
MSAPCVDIVLSVYNGAPWVEEQIQSIQTQTHDAWRLWVRDDGSEDGTAQILRRMADADHRIRLRTPGGERMGRARSFSTLLEDLPEDARLIFTADADDSWLPSKIEVSLNEMREAEGEAPGPILLHTDLAVTDARLEVLHDSLWSFLGIEPEPTPLRRIMVQNVATGPTVLVNREMLDLILPIPPEAASQDWWMALVACRFGRIVALDDVTVLYRRHGGNVTGEYEVEGPAWRARLRRGVGALGRTGKLRREMAEAATQAAAFLDRYNPQLTDAECAMLRDFAEIPHLGTLARKVRVLRLRMRREHGVLRNLALVLRA